MSLHNEDAYRVKPIMFSLFVLLKEIVNTPPSLQTDNFQVLQGFTLRTHLLYFDGEKDQVTFVMAQPPQHGVATLTSDGIFEYKSKAYYSGFDEILVDLIEINLPSIIVPQISRQIVILNVTEHRHPPTLMLDIVTKSVENNTVYPSGTVQIYIEANTTDKPIGSLYACDHNVNDQLVLFARQKYNNVAIYIQDVSSANTSNSQRFESCQYATSRIYFLSINTSMDFHGFESMTLIAGDDTLLYSQPMSLEIFIMINPCVHGACIDESCFSINRTKSFDGYICTCIDGYEGVYCQLEVDKCASITCNMSVLVIMITVFLLSAAVTVIVVLLIRLKM